MIEVKLELNEKGRGRFYITDDGEELGEMEISRSGNDLTVYHTEVSPKAEGKGFAKQLFSSMVDYARENKSAVIALCPFVHAQFKRHPDQYADIWKTPE